MTLNVEAQMFTVGVFEDDPPTCTGYAASFSNWNDVFAYITTIDDSRQPLDGATCNQYVTITINE